QGEQRRQLEKIELIASENFTSAAVMETVGSVLTNKYAEGYPGRRYYGGCEWVDQAEALAIERAKQLFGAQHANVQPHAGAQANMAAYAAVLQPGDVVLGMRLDMGGHLTHRSPVPHSQIVTTTTHKTLRGPRGGMILSIAELQKPIDSAVFPNVQGGPLMHVIAGKAVMLKEAMEPSFKEYASQIVKNAKV